MARCEAYVSGTPRWLPAAESTVQVVVAQQGYALGFAVLLVVAIWLLGGRVRSDTITPAGLASAVAAGVLYYAWRPGSTCRACAARRRRSPPSPSTASRSSGLPARWSCSANVSNPV